MQTMNKKEDVHKEAGENKEQIKSVIPVKVESKKQMISHNEVFENIMKHIKNDHGVIGVDSGEGANSNIPRLEVMAELSKHPSNTKKHIKNPSLFLHILEEANKSTKA